MLENSASNSTAQFGQQAGRVIMLVLDSFGIGASEDAIKFGDVGANTLGHIAEQCALGHCEQGRAGPLRLPNLASLGLFHAAWQSDPSIDAVKHCVQAMDAQQLRGAYGVAKELSTGKDTSSGHWEMSGVPVFFDWSYFAAKTNSFPASLLKAMCETGQLPGVLGNCHASGTEIIARLGAEHMTSGKPIVYTSADSVVQIAAHEKSFGLSRLLELCEHTRKILDETPGLNVGRVIARPFVGDCADTFTRTGNRRDYSVPPPGKTVLDDLIAAGGSVFSVGKIADIFAQQGITQCFKANGIAGLFDATLNALDKAAKGTLVFTNFVDFDSSYGHRRDVNGYAKALEDFDARLPELLHKMDADDLLIISADHGCDPTWVGSDHTREHVPLLLYGQSLNARDLGFRNSFADIGQTIAHYFALKPLKYGESCI